MHGGSFRQIIYFRLISLGYIFSILCLPLVSNRDKSRRIILVGLTGESMWSAMRTLFLLVLLSSSCPLFFAQGTDLGTIRGTVTDSSGAVVAGAKVAITDVGTGSIREMVTNAEGGYQVFGLRSGTYSISVANAGMTTVQVNGIVVNGSAVVIANANMKVASSSEVVSVTTEAQTINTADQTISDTITSREVLDLPRDSRDIFHFSI